MLFPDGLAGLWNSYAQPVLDRALGRRSPAAAPSAALPPQTAAE